MMYFVVFPMILLYVGFKIWKLVEIDYRILFFIIELKTLIFNIYIYDFLYFYWIVFVVIMLSLNLIFGSATLYYTVIQVLWNEWQKQKCCYFIIYLIHFIVLVTFHLIHYTIWCVALIVYILCYASIKIITIWYCENIQLDDLNNILLNYIVSYILIVIYKLCSNNE